MILGKSYFYYLKVSRREIYFMEISKKRISLLVIAIVLFSTCTVFAASRAFTYNFTHQVSIKDVGKAAKSSASITCYTTSNTSKQGSFTVKQYYTKSGVVYNKDSKTMKSKKSGHTVAFTTTKGTKYSYEFWKKQGDGRIIGSGDISY